MTFPETFKRRLRYSGYTQKWVASQLGVSATTVYYWASGRARPTLDHLVHLERVLECPPAELYIALTASH